MDLNLEQKHFLREKSHYIWWQSCEESLERPERLIAQIMDIGTLDDERELWEKLGSVVLLSVIRYARPGWFRPKSWAFWNYQLGVVPVNVEPPEMPSRRVSA